MKFPRPAPRDSRKWFYVILRLAIIAFLLVTGLFYSIRMPNRSYSGHFFPLIEKEALIRDRLQAHVYKLAGEIGQRNIWRQQTMEAAVRYIEKAWVELGYEVKKQEYTAYNTIAANLEIELRGTSKPNEIIIVGAHYDSVLNSPGANDNASGVAALLELSRLLANNRYPRTIRLAAFANEEPPFYFTDDMGSRKYASRSRRNNEQIVAMLSLETIGYYSENSGSQKYPFPLSAFYPDTANFIAFVGNIPSRHLVRQAIDAFRKHAKFPSEGLAAPGLMTGIGWSDHWSFWQEGYPAVMITDTAFFRYPYYHTAQDTPEKLDYGRMSRVVAGIFHVLADLAEK